jgi:DmsE family decaheme c-type cytochrome
MKRILACVVLLSAGLVLRLGASNPGQQAASPQQTATSPPPQQAAATYVGEATCIGCHDAEGQSIHKSPHGKPENPRSPAAVHGCETCHGPGSAHVEDPSKPGSIKRFGQLSARDASETCLTCHSRGEHQQWKGSMHEERNLSCITCHSVHNPKSETAQLKTVEVIDTCATCHKTEVAKLQRVGHMPVREGKMTCTSCHNPHGSTNTRMLRVGNFVNEACTSCHAEKRGPFLWDHAPVREGCNTCHDPHGSNNDRMLVAKLPMLCQRCHIGTKHPSTIYDANQLAKGSSRLIGRGCVNCHQQIHGSNSPAGNAFLR